MPSTTSELQIRISAEDKASAEFKKVQRSAEQLDAGFRRISDFGLKMARNAALMAGGAIVGMGAGLTAIVKSAANAGDEMQKMALRTGASTEFLSSMKVALDLADVSIEEFNVGLRGLARRMLDSKNGLAEAQRAFIGLGISVTDSEGNLRDLESMVLEAADRFKGMKNDTEAAALAQEIFGRSGANLLPLLKEGSAAIREQMKEAKALGVVWSQDAADAAALFNDEMTRLGKAFEGIKNAIAQDLIPIITPLITDFKDRAIIPLIAKTQEWMQANRELIGLTLREWFERAMEAGRNLLQSLRDNWETIKNFAQGITDAIRVVGNFIIENRKLIAILGGATIAGSLIYRLGAATIAVANFGASMVAVAAPGGGIAAMSSGMLGLVGIIGTASALMTLGIKNVSDAVREWLTQKGIGEWAKEQDVKGLTEDIGDLEEKIGLLNTAIDQQQTKLDGLSISSLAYTEAEKRLNDLVRERNGLYMDLLEKQGLVIDSTDDLTTSTEDAGAATGGLSDHTNTLNEKLSDAEIAYRALSPEVKTTVDKLRDFLDATKKVPTESENIATALGLVIPKMRDFRDTMKETTEEVIKLDEKVYKTTETLDEFWKKYEGEVVGGINPAERIWTDIALGWKEYVKPLDFDTSMQDFGKTMAAGIHRGLYEEMRALLSGETEGVKGFFEELGNRVKEAFIEAVSQAFANLIMHELIYKFLGWLSGELTGAISRAWSSTSMGPVTAGGGGGGGGGTTWGMPVEIGGGGSRITINISTGGGEMPDKGKITYAYAAFAAEKVETFKLEANNFFANSLGTIDLINLRAAQVYVSGPLQTTMGGGAPVITGSDVSQSGKWYHEGGMIRAHRGLYLAPDEVPIIAQTGEGVVNRKGMQQLGEMGLEQLNRGQGAHPKAQEIHIHYNIQAWDGADVERVFEQKILPLQLQYSRDGIPVAYEGGIKTAA